MIASIMLVKTLGSRASVLCQKHTSQCELVRLTCYILLTGDRRNRAWSSCACHNAAPACTVRLWCTSIRACYPPPDERPFKSVAHEARSPPMHVCQRSGSAATPLMPSNARHASSLGTQDIARLQYVRSFVFFWWAEDFSEAPWSVLCTSALFDAAPLSRATKAPRAQAVRSAALHHN
jgi:hypothetical protein